MTLPGGSLSDIQSMLIIDFTYRCNGGSGTAQVALKFGATYVIPLTGVANNNSGWGRAIIGGSQQNLGFLVDSGIWRTEAATVSGEVLANNVTIDFRGSSTVGSIIIDQAVATLYAK